MAANDNEPAQVGSFDILHRQAREAFAQGRWDVVVERCRRAILLKPQDVGVLNLLGQALLSMRQPVEAAETFRLAIEINRSLPNLLYNLCLACQALGDLDGAIASIHSAIALDPAVPLLHAKLGQLLIAAGASENAVTVLRHAHALDKDSPTIRLNLAQALSDVGLLIESAKLANGVLRSHPEEATAHRLLGRIAQMRGDFDQAATSFRKTIELQPRQAAGYFGLAYSQRTAPEDRPVISAMEQLLAGGSLSLSDAGLLEYALGKMLDDLNEYDAAWDHFERANGIALAARAQIGQRYEPEADSRSVGRITKLFPGKALPDTPGESGSNRIFVVGMIRSGTTLVEQILGRLPNVRPAGELSYWSASEPAMHDELASGDADPEAWREGYEQVLSEVSGTGEYVVDKMPLNYRAIGLVLSAYPNAKIIHCRRDPLDTILSIFATPYRAAPAFAHDLESILAAYQSYRELMNHWRSVVPANNLIQLDYESLVANPESEARRVVEACGLVWDTQCLEAAIHLAVSTPSQWQVRQPIYGGSVGRWKNYAAHLGQIRSAFE